MGENFDMFSISANEIERGLELGDLYTLFQPKPFYEMCLKAKKKLQRIFGCLQKMETARLEATTWLTAA